MSLPAGPPSSYESSAGVAAEQPPPKRQATGTLAWLSGGLGGGSWLKTMVAGGGGNPAAHIAPAAAEMGLAGGAHPGPLVAYEMAWPGRAPQVAGVEEGAAVEAAILGQGLPQDLVTEANPNPNPNPNP